MTRQNWWRVAQVIVSVVVLWLAGLRLWHQWIETNRADLHVSFDVPWVLVASVVVLVTYLLLIEVWRAVLALSGSQLPWAPATRIWFVSNLGKYLPGKVWQIGAMTALVGRYRISPAVAGAAAIVITVANVAAGFMFVLVAAARSLSTWGGTRATLFATTALVLLLCATPLAGKLWTRFARRLGKPTLAVSIPISTSLVSLAGSALAWFLYGVAFRLFALGVLGSVPGRWLEWGAAYTLSYLVGYLTLIVPGGVGVREVTLTQILTTLGLTTPAEAVILALTSRIWLTILELAPGVVAVFAGPDLRATETTAAS